MSAASAKSGIVNIFTNIDPFRICSRVTALSDHLGQETTRLLLAQDTVVPVPKVKTDIIHAKLGLTKSSILLNLVPTA